MSDPDTHSTSDPIVIEVRTSELYRKRLGQWRTLRMTIPFDLSGDGYVAVPLSFLPSAKGAIEEQPELTSSLPTVDETTLQHNVAMLADIDRIISRLDEEIPRAIDAMDHLLAEIHDPKKRSAA